MNVCAGPVLRLAIGANRTFTVIFLTITAAGKLMRDVEGTIGIPVVFFAVSVMEVWLPPCFVKFTTDGKNRTQQQTEIKHAAMENSSQWWCM